METFKKNNELWIVLPEVIDGNNITEYRKEVLDLCSNESSVCFDGEHLNSISSFGLRVFSDLIEQGKKVTIINLSDDVYDVIDCTGLADLMVCLKKFKTVSVDGLEKISQGQNGTVYSFNDELVIKVFRKGIDLENIINEYHRTKHVASIGIPCVMCYGIVLVDGSYGLVYEKMAYKSIAKCIRDDKDNTDFYLRKYADFIKKFNTYTPNKVFVDDIKRSYQGIVKKLEGNLEQVYIDKLYSILDQIPEGDGAVHGDFHLANARYSKDGMAAIDLETIAYGNRIFDLINLNATLSVFRMMSDNDVIHIGCSDVDYYKMLWDKTYAYVYDDLSQEQRDDQEKRIHSLACARVLKYCIKHNKDEDTKKIIYNELVNTLNSI